tara:strand:- start:229 stop:519 length:291 start_codon:yes stop_codon:yes gene_type:complete
MGKLAGVPNKLTTDVKDKFQNIMDDVVYQLDISEMTTDQKIKMLQIGLQYLLPKLKHVSGEAEQKDVPLFVDIISRDETGEGWETERRPLNICNSE